MKRTIVALGLVGLVAASLGCRKTVSGSLTTDQVGTKYARLTGYFSTRGGAQEDTPGTIRHDAIRDEALLAAVDAGETCFDVAVRTNSAEDEPFDQLQPRCEVDGREGRAIIENEAVTVYDYAYTGQVEMVSAQGIAAETFVGMSLSKPGEKVFRVVERKGRVCCGLSGRKVKLALSNERMRRMGYIHHLLFEWNVY